LASLRASPGFLDPLPPYPSTSTGQIVIKKRIGSLEWVWRKRKTQVFESRLFR
jgi:hypothetical protein